MQDDAKPAIQWGAIVAAAGVALATGGALASGVWVVAGGTGKTDRLEDKVTRMQGDVTSGFARLEGSALALEAQLRALQEVIPRLSLVERQLRDSDARDGGQDALIAAVRERQIVQAADLAAIQRASEQRLPGQPTVRRP